MSGGRRPPRYGPVLEALLRGPRGESPAVVNPYRAQVAGQPRRNSLDGSGGNGGG